ncbi:MAG: alpha-L-arabinofuranosidase C-terminal domain-containing protein [Planctomycetia bacterium]|nr:alpha-L-arabinofuranosidase C-terminal domain-containing protein [Planctomycetia bacterium]
MKRLFSLLSATAMMLNICVGTRLCTAENFEAVIQPQKTVNTIDPKVYGHFLEHIYNSCNGGLWGDLVWNRSFEAGNASGWSHENGVFTQKVPGNQVLLFGDDSWTDYEVTLDAKKLSGKEGFLILFHAKDEQFYWANLGGWGNEHSAFEYGTLEKRNGIENQKLGKFEPFKENQTYKIRLSVVGNTYKVFVDGNLAMEVTSEKGPKSGKFGIGTWDTQAEFSNIVVRNVNGNELGNGKTLVPQRMNELKVRYWNIVGNAVEYIIGDARNSKKFLRFANAGTIGQLNYKFVAGETYDYSYWTRGTGSVEFQATGSETLATKVNSAEWTKVTGSFKVSADTEKGEILFSVAPTQGKMLDLDQVSIMPRSWKENSYGFRPDLLKAIADIRPPVIRWPGGCYASVYRWKDGIGPQDDRGSYPIEIWNDVDVNSFGIDEFVQMCRLVGAEPIMVVNIGTKPWTEWIPEHGKVDWTQEICDWVEYCNGSVDTKWGALRAKNGHPEPYNVKYWEIDNEVNPEHNPYPEYVATLNNLIPEMKKIDPNITIIACGSWTGDLDQWDREVLNGAGDKFSYLSTHRYDNPDGYAVNPYENQRFFESRGAMIRESGNTDVRMFDSEWNAQSTDWRTGLHAGGILNCFERVGDVLHIASPALFLRHTSADAWDNAFINFDHTGWFPAPNYVVMKLWYDNYAPNRVVMQSSSPIMNGKNPLVNGVATRSEDGKTVIFKVVNNQMEAAQGVLKLDGVNVKNACAQVVTPELADGEEVKAKLQKRNTLAEPNAIAPKTLETSVNGNAVKFDLPALSAAVIKISVE